MRHARPDLWLWGLPVLAGLWAAALWLAAPAFEAALRARIVAEGGVATSEPMLRAGARVVVEGRDVSVLTDTGLPPPLASAVTAGLAAIDGVRRVEVVTPPPVALSPFVFAVRRRDGALRLSGGVTSPDLHAALSGAARATVSAERLDDRLRLATGAPAGFDEAARRLLDLAGLLASGDASLTGTTYTLAGEARDFSAYNAARDLLARPLAGFEPADIALRPPVAPAFAWSATRAGDAVTLGGFVPSETARQTVVAAARGAFPRGDVVDRMQTARGLDASVPFETVAAAGLRAIGRLQAGSVALAGRGVALEGASPARDLLAEIWADFTAALPPAVKADRIALSPVPADPFRLTVTRGNGRVTLDGFVPDAAARTSLLAAISSRFPAEAIVDGLHQADGAPPGFTGVATGGLAALSDLAEGTLALNNRTARLSGSVLYPGLASRLGAAWPATMPAGWTATADLDTPSDARTLDALQCADLVADALRRAPIRFEPGKAELPAAARAAADGVAAVLRRCASARVRLVQPVGEGEEAAALAARRAEAVLAHLRAAGIGGALAAGTAPVARGGSPDVTGVSVE